MKDDDHAAYMRDWRRRRREALESDGSRVPHGTDDGYRNWSCRCAACREASTKATAERNARIMVEQREERRATWCRRNREAAMVAANHGKQWTGADLEVATARRADGLYLHTVSEVAQILGRSLRSVGAMREKCAHDPKYVRILGARNAPPSPKAERG